MKYIRKVLLLFIITVMITILSSCNNKKVNNNSFYYTSYKTSARYSYDVFYTDDYFNKSASLVDRKLATASSCLALAGGASPEGMDYKNASGHIKYFFNLLGFNTIKANNYYDKVPTKDSFGVCVAKREIDDYTLIGIGVRGYGYLREWASNFKLGNDLEFAEGFYDASNIYLDTLKDYILTNNIKGKIKIWTAGYSRGGAVVNLSIGRIDDGLKNNINILNEDVSFTKDDIYAYCFEAPRGRIATVEDGVIKEKNNDYSNIQNIINVNDLVTYVAPNGLGFIRYGIDYYLPDIITSLDYINFTNDLKNAYSNMPNKDAIGSYDLDTFVTIDQTKENYTLGLFLMNFIDEISNSIHLRENYYNNFEGALTSLAEALFSTDSFKEILIDFGINLGKRLILDDPTEILIKDALYNRKRFFSDLKPILDEALDRSQKLDISVDEIVNLVKELVPIIIDVLSSSDNYSIIHTLLNKSNLSLLMRGHIPELLLAAMTSMDSNYGYNEKSLTTSYYKLMVSINSNIVIKNGNDIYYSDSINRFAKKDDTDYKIIYLPYNDYEIISYSESDILLYEESGKYLSPKLILDTSLNKNEKLNIKGGN